MSDLKPYRRIVEHYESCLAEHGDGHKAVDWPNELDAQTRYRVMLELARDESREKVSLLDFGCGLGALYQHIQTEGLSNRFEYSGLDLSELFVQRCAESYPEVSWYCEDLLSEDPLSAEWNKSFDYIVLNGVFTEKRELAFSEMLEYFKLLTKAVFQRARSGVAFNVMSPNVEWSRLDLFHLSFDILCEFLARDISRNFVIRNDYGLYEYTVYVYR